MLVRLCICLTLGIACGLFLGACNTPGLKQKAASRDNPAQSVAVEKRAGKNPSDKDLAEAHAHYMNGVLLGMRDETALALEEFYQAASKDPGNETLVLEVTRRFLLARKPEKALDLLMRATSRANASGAVYARLGFVYTQLGKSDLAISANRTAIKRQPQSLAGYQNLFLNYLQSNRQQEAAKVLDEGAKVAGTEAEFLVGLGELYASFGLQVSGQRESAFAKSLDAFLRAEKTNPKNTQLLLRLADGFNAIGSDENASRLYSTLLKRFAELPLARETIRERLTGIFLRDNDHQRAVEQLQAILRDNPTDARTAYYLGSIYYEDKNFTEAMDYFSRTLVLNPDFEPAYYNLAGAQIDGKKPGEARATLEKAREKFPRRFSGEYLAGVACNQQKDYAEAIKHFTTAEVIAGATDPKRLDGNFYFEVGATYERKGDYAQAETFFQKSIELSPDYSDAQNYLGYMWAERGERLEEARVLIEKALKAEPKNDAYLDSMGWVLFKLNKPKEALTYILKAIENLEEPDATVYDHLGDIYAALGQTAKALEAWRKSVSIEANEQIQKKLDGAK